MKILVLTKYPVKGPSSRYRFHQYRKPLEAKGFKLHFRSFFTQTYLDHLFKGKSVSKAYLAQRFLGRAWVCLFAKRFDLVWIEGEIFPFLPSWFEKMFHVFLPSKRVYDYDDAVWFRYENKPMLADKYLKILADASLVTVGNDYLRRYVAQVQTDTVHLPTVVHGGRYQKHRAPLKGNVIGWIGSPSTLFFLERLKPVFLSLKKIHSFEIHIVGAEVVWEGLQVTCFPWAEAEEIERIKAFSVGVMPLDDSEFAKGKCGLKLIQYLATGVPAVASPVGVNTNFIKGSGGGFLAGDLAEWEAALGRMLEEETLRATMGAKGQAWVHKNLTVEVQAPVLIRALNQVLG